MAEITWHLPLRCPKCETADGHPCRVESKTAAAVSVLLRCGTCAHEWIEHRETPLLMPTPPSRLPPEEQA
jgi:hypothetical protein